VIRTGTVADCASTRSRPGGCVTEVRWVDGPARREVDADGLLARPGFVDIHTHYDGQVTWDDDLTPSCWHGVTTAILGNCGVGFAPVQPGPRAQAELIELMEGVEEIPGSALSEGMSWSWTTFPGTSTRSRSGPWPSTSAPTSSWRPCGRR
jgi:N-acyl-D-aspartate/D-glutamate deacylase